MNSCIVFLFHAGIETLRATEVKDTTATFSWDAKEIDGNEVFNVKIYVFPAKNTADSSIWEFSEPNQQICIVGNLSSNTKYAAYGVMFLKEFVPEEGSPNIVDFQTTPMINLFDVDTKFNAISFHFIYTAPQKIKVSSRTDSSIEVSWKIPENEVKSPPINYIVKANDRGCNSTQKDTCEVKNLTSNTFYEVTIEACSAENSSICSEKSDVSGFTAPAAVKGLRVSRVGSHKAIFYWSEIPPGTGKLKNLTVYVFPRGGSKDETIGKCTTTDADINSMPTCTAMALSPNAQYSATAVVCSEDEYGCSMESDTIDFQTPPPAPIQIVAGAVGRESVEVQWTPVLTHGFVGYQAAAFSLSGNSQSKPQTCKADASEKSCVIRNLQPSTRYTITVTSYTKTSDGKTLFGDEILFLNISTKAGVDLRKVVAAIILIPLFVVLLFLILFALRNRIPALQPLFNRRPRVDTVQAPMATISYRDGKTTVECLSTRLKTVTDFGK
ncbi:unnamed protein product [Rodentolepis nana]|uniref:Fibronectin type-III domain-containing protein n=1 Tax=Rodentolepis nana TaxID=102285 RepID=A0A3P7SPD8_RODNA|nr:unnamed protein product [Rodentolepis nana]